MMGFCGGARTVTGSQHLLSANGSRILMECGLFQGSKGKVYGRARGREYAAIR